MMDKPRLRTSDRRRWGRLKQLGRLLRSAQTPAEGVLWERLRRGRLGVRFRRQHALDRFIVDFYAPAARLIVEVDGAVHATRQGADEERDARLRMLGYRILRFTNEEVIHDTDSVMARIAAAVGADGKP